MRFVRKTHPPGTAPGTITAPAVSLGPPNTWLTHYSATTVDESEVSDLETLRASEEGVRTWLDIQGHDPHLIKDLGQRLGVHPLALEDVVNVGQRPKVEEYEGCLFVILHHLQRPSPEAGITTEQISLVLQDGVVVSIREQPSAVWDLVRTRLRGHSSRIRTNGVDYLAYALVDAVVDHYFPLLDEVDRRLETIEESLTLEARSTVVQELHGIRRDLALIRRSVWPLRDMLTRFIRTENPLIEPETRIFLRDVVDHLALVADMVETYTDLASGLMDLSLSSMSNRMNEVMQMLTIIATIFIPLSFIAGLYGMNFDREAGPWNMPELGWSLGYPAVLLLMVAVAGGLLLFFRKRKWL